MKIPNRKTHITFLALVSLCVTTELSHVHAMRRAGVAPVQDYMMANGGFLSRLFTAVRMRSAPQAEYSPKWQYDAQTGAYYRGKPLSAIAKAQSARVPAIDDKKKDMIAFTSVAEMKTTRGQSADVKKK